MSNIVEGRLTEQQIKEALSRAEEIHLRAAMADEHGPAIESVLAAAEEIGLPREAMRQALRERLGSPMNPQVGDRVFARSVDGHFYVATVEGISPDGVDVKFLSGGASQLSLADLRPFTFAPGMKIYAHWPVWGWCKVDVVGFDSKRDRVVCSDGWSEKKMKLHEVRLGKAKASDSRARLYWVLIGLGTLIGGPLGAAITYLLMR